MTQWTTLWAILIFNVIYILWPGNCFKGYLVSTWQRWYLAWISLWTFGFVSPEQLQIISIRNALAQGGAHARNADEVNLCWLGCSFWSYTRGKEASNLNKRLNNFLFKRSVQSSALTSSVCTLCSFHAYLLKNKIKRKQTKKLRNLDYMN